MSLLLLYIFIFWYLWNFFFSDLIKHYVLCYFFSLFLSLQLIFVHELFIEYDISTPNDFFIFIIPEAITKIINIISNKGTLLGFFLKICSIFFINMDKCFTTESLQKRNILPFYLSMPPLEFHHPNNLKFLYLLSKQ
jgi:hypothetical protein